MHRSLSIELDLSSPTKRFSLAGLEFHSGNRPRSLVVLVLGGVCCLGLYVPTAWRGAALYGSAVL